MSLDLRGAVSPAGIGRRGAAAALATALALALAFVLGRAHPFGGGPPASTSTVVVAPSPNVIVAVRELARLETTGYHVERVIELADHQDRLFGLLHVKDGLLLVAAGDVTAGVDLAKLGDGDVTVDWEHRRASVRLPPPEIFSVALDNARTHVVTRTTDAFASRREALEGEARAEAESSMRQGAIDGGVLDRAKAGGVRAVRELLRGLGFQDVEVD